MPQEFEKIKYSLLELAVLSEGNTVQDTFRNSVDLAQHAESFGYTRYWLAEHHNSVNIASSATSVLIGHVAEKTKTIRVGSGGIMLPNHSPLIVAEQFGTLGQLYPNRIDLGLGRAPGTDQVTAQAMRGDRMQSVNQFPADVSQIQNYFSTENSSSNVRVTMAEGVDVPLYILGSSTDSAYLAAEKGLPYAFASHFATNYLDDALEIYYNNFVPSKYLDTPYTIACVNIIAADTNEEADRNMTSLLRMFVGVLTGKREALQPPTEMTSDFRALMNNQTLYDMLRYSFVGDKERVKAKTLDFLKRTGVNEIMAVSNMYDHQTRVNSYRIFGEIMQEIG